MNTLLALVAAMAISMMLIPIMVRFAPRLGLMNRPNVWLRIADYGKTG